MQTKPATQGQTRRRARRACKDIQFHILLKVHSEAGLTISAHMEMVKRRGVALLGKMGSPLGKDFQEALNEQIARGVETYLFLATRGKCHGEYVIHRCVLLNVYDGLLDPKREALVPLYYAYEISGIYTWFEISGIHLLSHEQADRIFVLSSGNSILSVITGRASLFRVGIYPKR